MDMRSKKLELSRETLLSLEDQDLSGVVGGQLLTIGIESTLCNSGVCHSGALCCSSVCNSVVCDSAVCGIQL